MFGIESSELAIVALVALVVIGPKDLPRVMRMVGNWLAKGRAMTRHVRAGFDTMMREAELEEMQKQWAAQNEAIMKATALPDLGLADPKAQLGLDTSHDHWMAPETAPEPAPQMTPEPAAEMMPLPAPVPPPLPAETVDIAPAAKPRRSRAKAEGAAKPPRRRQPKAIAEPQPTEP